MHEIYIIADVIIQYTQKSPLKSMNRHDFAVVIIVIDT